MFQKVRLNDGNEEVKVDAGNGKVLYTENEQENEASRSKSSIQVPQQDNENESNEGRR